MMSMQNYEFYTRTKTPYGDMTGKVLALSANGLAKKEIASEICRELQTVSWHFAQLKNHYQARNHANVIALAMASGDLLSRLTSNNSPKLRITAAAFIALAGITSLLDTPYLLKEDPTSELVRNTTRNQRNHRSARTARTGRSNDLFITDYLTLETEPEMEKTA